MNSQERALANQEMNLGVLALNLDQARRRAFLLNEEGAAVEARLLQCAGERDRNSAHPVQRMIDSCTPQQNQTAAQAEVAGLLRAKFNRHCFLCSR